MLATYEGGCHCGQVRFRVQGDLDRVSVCNCSICTMKGIIHMEVSRERFELLRGDDALSTYTFGTGVAKHYFCKTCGIKPFYVPRSNPDGIDVNVRCLDPAPASLEVRPFDGRDWEASAPAIAALSREG